MCCGQKRSALKAGPASSLQMLNLRYEGAAQVHVRGAFTGRLYQFSRLHPVQQVDPRDAAALLETPRFRQAR